MTRSLGIDYCFHMVEKLLNYHVLFYIYIILHILKYVTCIFIYHIYIHINTHVDVVNIIVHIKTFTFKTEYWDSDCGLSSGLFV